MEYVYVSPSAGFPAQEGQLAMAYVPMQVWRQLYDPNVGFSKGTIFTELDKPFCGKEGCPK